MLSSIPIVWQYVIIGVAALLATVLVLWLYNRREKRRKHAIELAKLMTRWGMDWFAEAYEMYAVGDYSGLTWKVKEIVTAVRSDEAMVGKLADVARKVATYYAANEPDKAAELRTILSPAAPAKASAGTNRIRSFPGRISWARSSLHSMVGEKGPVTTSSGPTTRPTCGRSRRSIPTR
ncbi:MAG: hypothetical protein HQ567_13385 [Candidatus Nealsonbacteria bacterium]|nr:hypothetical protein [Candidatus Nealsonbacteria bacterium]